MTRDELLTVMVRAALVQWMRDRTTDKGLERVRNYTLEKAYETCPTTTTALAVALDALILLGEVEPTQ